MASWASFCSEQNTTPAPILTATCNCCLRRPSDLEQYFLDFNGRLGLSVLGHELAQRAADPAAGTAQQGQRPEASDTTQPADQLAHSTAAEQQQLSSTKVVLVGHSMGGACAALATLEKPQQVAALVLVAPAIFALPGHGRERGMLVHERSRSLAPAAEEQTSFEQPAAARGAGNRAASASSLAGSDDGNDIRAEDGAGALGRQDSATSLGMASPNSKESKQQPQGSGTAPGPQEHVMVLQMHPEEHAPAPPPPKAPGRAQLLAKAATSAVQAVAAACILAAIMVLKPLIVLLLRMVVRSKSFWERGLASAYYDSSKLTAEVVDAYRMPQLVRGWEDGMLQFVLARLAGASRLGKLGFRRKSSSAGSASSTDASASNASSASGIMMVRDAVYEGLRPAALGSAGAGAATAAAAAADPEGSLADQLAAVVEKHRIPVLLVHGEGDRIVPISNSKRLAKRLPGCKLSVYTQCGHMPQEELPEGFVATVTGFLQEVAAGAGKKRQ
jgi:pimeloyl-ACP methyl ester carboxylesterase